MLGVTFHELEKSVEAAKAEAASTAIQLADDEHLQKHNVLVEDETKITAALTRTTLLLPPSRDTFRNAAFAGKCWA